jgi:hypothetical protein
MLLRRVFVFATAVACAYVAWVFASRAAGTRRWSREHAHPAAADAAFERLYGGTDVRILQFYARESSVVEGGKSVICYGVVNAKSVRTEPPIPGISPALNRCVEAAPGKDTRYTLIAEGEDGRVVSESFVLGVHPDQDTLPRITSFGITKTERDYTGKWIFSLRFEAQNPEEVSIDPPVFPTLHRSPYGSFYVAPAKTTTYTLTVTGKFGHKSQRQLTVQVPPG